MSHLSVGELTSAVISSFPTRWGPEEQKKKKKKKEKKKKGVDIFSLSIHAHLHALPISCASVLCAL